MHEFISKTKDSNPEPWMGKIMDAAGRSWESEGSMNVDFIPGKDGFYVRITPALREIVGGEKDGEQIYALFSFNLMKFIKAFDTKPKIIFHSSGNGFPAGLDIQGYVMRTKVLAGVFGGVIPNQPCTELAYVSGPKQGALEQKMMEEPEDEEL